MFVSFSLKSLRLSMQMLGGSKRGQGMGTDHCSKSLKFSICKFSSLALSKLCSGCGLFNSPLPVGSTQVLPSHDFSTVCKYPPLGRMRFSQYMTVLPVV